MIISGVINSAMYQTNKSTKAILVLDIQNDFTRQNGRLAVSQHKAIKIIANLNKIIDESLQTGLTVIYIGNEYSKFNILNIFRNFAAVKGKNGTKIDSRLHVSTKHYFSKSKDNAFTNPGLHKFLKEREITDVYIGGLYAEACIYKTAKAAIMHNYETTILKDCIATRKEARFNKILRRYQRIGANII
jgi:nicotinamidase-related amidase